MLVQTRKNRNINVIEANNVPIINYDVVISDKFDESMNLLLSKINNIRYFYIIEDGEINVPKGYKLLDNKHILEKVDFSINESQIITQNKANLSTENIRSTTSLVNKVKMDNVEKNNFYIRNIVSTKTSFNGVENYDKNEINGQLDILCILEFKKDNQSLLNLIEYIDKNYKNTKFFIFLIGSTIKKYFKYEILNNLNYVLFESLEKENFKEYEKIFNQFSKSSLKLNLKEINLNKNILDVLNENSFSFTNI